MYRFQSRRGTDYIEWYIVDRRTAEVQGPNVSLPYHMTAATREQLHAELKAQNIIVFRKDEALGYLRRMPERDYSG